jgi:hypothetical protein
VVDRQVGPGQKIACFTVVLSDTIGVALRIGLCQLASGSISHQLLQLCLWNSFGIGYANGGNLNFNLKTSLQ